MVNNVSAISNLGQEKIYSFMELTNAFKPRQSHLKMEKKEIICPVLLMDLRTAQCIYNEFLNVQKMSHLVESLHMCK